MANQLFDGRRLYNSGKVDISDGAAHVLMPTAGQNTVNNLHFISIVNTSANATAVTITDGFNTLVIGAPANAVNSPVTLKWPLQSLPNTGLTAQATSGQTSIIISAIGTLT